jgi:hypothetical protein
MALTNEQVASLDETSVLRVVRGHNLLGEEGKLVRSRHAGANVHGSYIAVDALDGSLINGSWFPDRFDLVEPQSVTGPLPASTLLRCINVVGCTTELTHDAFYRLLDMDDSFVRVNHLNGGPVKIDGGSAPFGLYPRRFVYYPDSAPAEPTTEKGTTMSDTITTVPLTRDVAATLPIGAVLIYTMGGDDKGKKYTLDRAGIDSDGDFHGTFEDREYAHWQRWSNFDLPANDTLAPVTPEPTVNPLAAELTRVRGERDAFEGDLDRVIDALRQEAIDREWCSEYDRFMERLGFAARCTRKFTVRRRATIEWDEEIEANSEDDAREQADNNEPSYVRDLDSDCLDLENIEIVDVEEA